MINLNARRAKEGLPITSAYIGLHALRGIGRAQDLYTLDPDIASSEPVTGSYERYLAS